jgi:hypothetical protein
MRDAGFSSEASPHEGPGAGRGETSTDRADANCVLRGAFEEVAQNGVRREIVPNASGGARRTLCASKELAHNALASGAATPEVPLWAGAALGGLCAVSKSPATKVRASFCFLSEVHLHLCWLD